MITFSECVLGRWLNSSSDKWCPQHWPTPTFAPEKSCAGVCGVGRELSGFFQSWPCTPCLGGFTCRLKLLLKYNSILRPQYQCFEGFANIWGANKEIVAALQDPVILQATYPYDPAGNALPYFWHFWKLPFSRPVSILLNFSVRVLVCVCVSLGGCGGSTS